MGDAGHFLGCRVEDGVVERGAEVAIFFGANLGEIEIAFVIAVQRGEDGWLVGGPVADQAQMVAKADGEGFVRGREGLAEEFGDVALVFLDEFFLAAAGVDDQADAERKLLGAGKELDRLRNTVFEDGEVVLFEVENQAAVGVMHADGRVDQVGFGLKDGSLLSVGEMGHAKDCGDQGNGLPDQESRDLVHGFGTEVA
jgi:hypothetical protein